MNIWTVVLATIIIKFLINMYLLCSTVRSHKSIKKSNLKDDKNLYLVVRVLNEERTIVDFLEKHLNLLQRKGLYIIIAGSEKERDIDGLNLTLESVRHFLINCDDELREKIIISEAPLSYGTGIAAQTNYAIDNMTVNNEDTWIMTADVDAVISSENCNEIMKHINENQDIIEIQSTFVKNYHRVSLWQKMHAIYQDRWSVVVEVFCGKVKNWWPRFYANVSGCGMCIRVRTIKDLGLLPVSTDYEDIHFSFLVNSVGMKIKMCMTRILCDTPKTLKEGLRQEYEWSFSSWDLFYYISNLRENYREKTSKINFIIASGVSIFLLMIWFFYSFLFIFFLYRGILGNHYFLIYALLILIDFEIFGVVINLKQKESLINTLLVFILMPIEIFRISIPCLFAGVARLTRIRGRKRDGIYKTDHN